MAHFGMEKDGMAETSMKNNLALVNMALHIVVEVDDKTAEMRW